ncbi:phosphoribosylglycinamide formyltransferase [Aliiglaciecola sp. LCG003]|uniref:phosphoribosylglycinamide formyltransferase n=1 Tax=Aliiglaciecola sp. LCG003 TaxID=3053655 RepID=UPI002572511D|nr:phosphoribosylglycinamide formyltransferase [Aliiglaciecola sp. LCG003]WJG11138.1 phosphoribosylglycinamide formyltransferase [Aliiglaciecola sp. LCG003]
MINSPTSVAVLISGNGSNLQAILDYFNDKPDVAKIIAVISNVDGAYGLTRAQQAKVPGIVIDHKAFSTRQDYDQALLETLTELQVDLVVLAGFMRILSEDFVKTWEGKMLNIHPSLLPKYKGLHTHQKALDAGDKEHGASVHFVTPELDGGPVIIQSKVPVFEDDTTTELAERVQQQERNIYPLVVDWFCSKRLVMVNNKAVLDGNELPESGYAAD